ncbi:hypothetical protein HanRHA438_Chr04g0152321 [Helianthus annuus]|nr:hypothetical protein HanIR_Chr04g0152471 [Helianthus annuus]KAJ0924782.1 hypothetical protein HanRHA438_Chr04g0152321 [Helianthus annuus]
MTNFFKSTLRVKWVPFYFFLSSQLLLFPPLNTIANLPIIKLQLQTSKFPHLSHKKNHQNPRERMEQKLPIITKKIWSLTRAIFFTLKKDIFKKKFLLHFNTVMKRGKMAEKSPFGEYEFSCRNTPSFPLSLFSTHKKHQNYRLGHSNSNLPLSVDDVMTIVNLLGCYVKLDLILSLRYKLCHFV